VSYILDALRRADAERQRGAVPGLHDQTTVLVADRAPAQPGAGPAARSALLWAGAAALMLVLVLGTAWWSGRGTPAAVATAPSVPGPVVLGVAPRTAPGTTPVATPAITRPAVAPPAATAPAAAPLVGRAPSPVPAPATQQVAVQPAPRAVAQAASDPVRSWASLPEASRSAMPALVWSGVVYAERAEQRLVVVNGQVAREGDALGSGLQLLQIRPKSVLLRWQGQRVEMPV